MSGTERLLLTEQLEASAVALPAHDDSTEATRVGTGAHDRAIVHGVLWQGALRSLAQVLSWSATIVIARRLSPEDYGLAGTAIVLVSLLSLVTEGGMGRALVMRRERSDVVTRQAHGASIAVGVTMAILMLSIASPVGRFYADQRVVPLIAVLSLVLMLSGLNAIPTAVMMQQLQYRRLAAADFAKAIVQASVVMIGAALGYGAWSLIAGLIVGHLTATLMTRRWVKLSPLRPTRSELEPTLRYAQHLVVGSFAWFFYSNADFAVVGRVAGLTALGYYQFGWNLAQLPGEKLGNVLQAVVGPFFGAIGNDLKNLRHYFLLLSELLVSVMFPVLGGFALVAHDAVPLIFGAKWLPAVPIMQILVVSSALFSVSMLSQHVMVATGNASMTSRVNVIAAIVMPVAFYIAARFSGSFAVACVWLVAQPILMTLPLLHVRKAIGLPVRTYFGSLRAPACSVAVMAASVLITQKLMSSQTGLTRFAAMSVVGAVVYVTTFRMLFPDRVRAIVSVWKSRA